MAGGILVVLAAFLMLAAFIALSKPSREPDNDAYNAGRVFGVFILPALAGFGAYACFKQSRKP